MRESGKERWPALPFWETIAKLDEQLHRLADDTSTKAVRNAFIAQFVESVANIARPSVTTAVIHRGLDWSSSAAAWAALDEPSIAAGVRDELPVIDARLKSLAGVFARSAKLLAARLQDLVVAERGEVSHIRLLGDMHARGAVALLYIDSVPQLVYKPRSLSVDIFFDRVLDLVRVHAGGVSVPRHPRSYDRGEFGFQEYVDYSSPLPGNERKRFYEQYGVLVTLSYALKFNDLHCENIRATATGPVVVDSECILNFESATEVVGTASSWSLYRAHPTVFDSQILPNWRMTFTSAGPREVTALGNYAHDDRLPVVRSVVIEDGAPRYEYTRSAEPGSLPNQPLGEFGAFPAGAYRDDLVRGFDTAYEALLKPDVQERILQYAAATDNGRTRLVGADTAAYETLLQSARELTPETLPTRSVLAGALLDAENYAVSHGVVPVVERGLIDGTLVLDDGNTVATSDSPLTRLYEHLASLSDEDQAAQRTALLLTLELGAYNPSDGPPPPAIALRTTNKLSERIDDLVAYVSRAVLGNGDQRWAIKSDELRPNYFTLRCSPPGLYAGVSGIAVALGIAGQSHDRARELYLDIRDTFFGTLSELAEQRQRGEPAVASTLTGVGALGPMLGFATISALDGDADALGQIARSGREYFAAGVSSGDRDLINGTAGIVIGLSRLYEATQDPAFLEYERDVVESLVDDLHREVAQPAARVGLAHGLSGVALALNVAANDLNRPHLRETALLCLDLEDELIEVAGSDERASSWSWCWGAVGQLTARLSCDHESERIDLLRKRVLAAESNFHGICHGLAGALLLVRSDAYRARFGDDPSAVRSFTGRMMLGGAARRVAPSVAPDAGLYTGAAGVLVTLASVRDETSFSIPDLRYAPCRL